MFRRDLLANRTVAEEFLPYNGRNASRQQRSTGSSSLFVVVEERRIREEEPVLPLFPQ
jgi:hypothetical protein